MLKISVKQMDYETAKQITKWNYEKPFSIYNMNESDECIKELLSGYYFSAYDDKNNIVGYYGFGEAAQIPIGEQLGIYSYKNITDIGIGLNPNLCGQGLGFDFFCCGLDFARNTLCAKDFRLTVATFNKPAIKIYTKLGFKKITSFKAMSTTGEIEFWVMTLCI
ncbi:acetyltransferase [Clostridium acetobutylicum]|nr:acetyltransferase [Clostridium acetobutylicum]